jgi:hypothetical protein
MTPEAIRIVSQLRREFYSLFTTAMKLPVNITGGNSYASDLSMASWIDEKKRLNYVRVYAHTAPDELFPKRPFILRVAVNKGAEIAAAARRAKGCQELNQSWYFELTLLPEEILDFLPWIVNLVKSYDKDSASLVPDPPRPINCKTSHALSFEDAWTQKAWQKTLLCPNS